MASLYEIVTYLDNKFETRTSEDYKKEAEITYDSKKDIKKIGYATNLTIEVIKHASKQGVDLIVTHHDAWRFIDGLKEECIRLLHAYGISHYYNHLPLDDSDFGTNSSLAAELGLRVIKKCADYNGFKCGLIGEYDKEISFKKFIGIVEDKLGEKVLKWKFNNNRVRKIFILYGAGHLTTDIKEAVDEECDVYLTGEKILYSVEYAQFRKINLVVGSHTFTELFGVKSMAELMLNKFSDMELTLIKETHIEELGYK